ncbi:MAG TPA: creatininase family protein [Candidatus Dormibacteraeota bacterium]|nr:creatininase family protein [Candidatus Dormibacteraeota bacterium]
MGIRWSNIVLAAIFLSAIPALANAMPAKQPTVLMEEMSWTEIRDTIKSGKTTVLLVAGSVEQHGPHLPTMTDSLVGKYIAQQVALKLGDALVAPVLQPGLAEHHLGFPGTISLNFQDFISVLTDYCTSLAQAGFKNIVLISSHGGNTDTMIAYAPRIAKQLLNQADVYMATNANGPDDARRRKALAEKYHISIGKAGVHSGWMESSMVLAIRPDLVDMSKAEEGLDDDTFYSPQNAKRNQLRGFAVGVKPYSANGILGDPRGATAEAGKEILAMNIDELVQTVRMFKQQ